MSALVIDASIAVKWVVEEDGTPQALMLRQQAKLIAPDLLIAECANILWKKVQRNELSKVSRSNSIIRPMIASISPWRSIMAASSSPPMSASCASLIRGDSRPFAPARYR